MSDARPYVIAGYTLRCRHCSGSRFHYQRLPWNRPGSGADLLGIALDVIHSGPIEDQYICDNCGCVHSFFPRKTANKIAKRAPLEREDSFACLNCQATIPAGSTRCKECGWSYE